MTTPATRADQTPQPNSDYYRAYGVPGRASQRKAAERSKKLIRRGHPTTSSAKLYGGDETDFLRAVDLFRIKTKTAFPTCTEILRVAESVGYARVGPGCRVVPVASVPVNRMYVNAKKSSTYIHEPFTLGGRPITLAARTRSTRTTS